MAECCPVSGEGIQGAWQSWQVQQGWSQFLTESSRTGEFLRTCSWEAKSYRLAKLSQLNSSEDRVFQKVLSACNYYHCSLFNKGMPISSGIPHSQSKRSVCSKVQRAGQG